MTADSAARTTPARLARPVGMPVLLLAIVVALWLASDRLGSIGPLDKASFGWVVLVPLWLAVPVVSAALWRPLSRADQDLAALLLFAIVATAASTWFWSASVPGGCAFGARTSLVDWILPSLGVGVATAFGPSLGGLLGARQAPHLGRAPGALAAVAVGLAFLLLTVAVVVITTFGVGGCMRPPA